MELDSTTPTDRSRLRLVRGLVVMIVAAALVGLGVWVGSSYLNGTQSVTPSESELTAPQHTSLLVRSLRITAASDTTPPDIDSIPESTVGVEPLDCGNRFTAALEDAVTHMFGVDYVSAVAGARSADVEPWKLQQSQAHSGAIALNRIFPEDCAPTIPVTYSLHDNVRFADAVSIDEMLPISDDLVAEWSQLYLLAETTQEREIALSGLWQVIRWQSAASPGRSPFAFDW